MKLVFFGTPEFAVPTLNRLQESSHSVVEVVTRPDKPAGRRGRMTAPAIRSAAERLRIPCLQPVSLKGEEFKRSLADSGADAAVVVAYGRLIPDGLLGLPRYGFVNLHPSLLPRHRGPSPIQWALASGDSVTGVTTIRLDEGMDTGPILLSKSVAIDLLETADVLAGRLAEIGAEVIVETLDRLQAGSLAARPQATTGVTVTPLLKRAHGQVDWTCSSSQLVNRERGFTPWPGLFTTLRGERLKLFGLAAVSPPPGDEPPGTVLETARSGIVVRCGSASAVLVSELQREGRQRLGVAAFLSGDPLNAGERFG